MMTLYNVLSEDDVCRVVDVFVRAFYDYPIHAYWFPINREEKMKHLFNFVVRMMVRYGQVFGTSIDLEGVCMGIDSRQNIGLKEQIRCGGVSLLLHLGFKLLRKTMSFDNFSSNLHKKHMNRHHHYYLTAIGVDPKYQGKGFGSKLMRSKFKDLEKNELPIYLETHMQEDVAIWQHLGFEIIDKKLVPNTDIHHWCMVWYPNKNSEDK